MGKESYGDDTGRIDELMVHSVEKAFRLLVAFDAAHRSLSLTQLASRVGMNRSAVQRFAHTLERLGYLCKDPVTKHFGLTVRTLDVGFHFLNANPLVDRAMPYLQHLSRTTEETINLVVRDDTEIVFLSRFMSRHVLNTDVVVGTRMPVFCTAGGLAILSALPREEARQILLRSERKAFTPSTLTTVDVLMDAVGRAARKNYSTAFDQFYQGDLTVSAPVRDHNGYPVAALNIAVSRARFTPEQAEADFAPLVAAAALSLSQSRSSPSR